MKSGTSQSTSSAAPEKARCQSIPGYRLCAGVGAAVCGSVSAGWTSWWTSAGSGGSGGYQSVAGVGADAGHPSGSQQAWIHGHHATCPSVIRWSSSASSRSAPPRRQSACSTSNSSSGTWPTERTCSAASRPPSIIRSATAVLSSGTARGRGTGSRAAPVDARQRVAASRRLGRYADRVHHQGLRGRRTARFGGFSVRRSSGRAAVEQAGD